MKILILGAGAVGGYWGARLHQAGCMGCIGMGQAPATGEVRRIPAGIASGPREDISPAMTAVGVAEARHASARPR